MSSPDLKLTLFLLVFFIFLIDKDAKKDNLRLDTNSSTFQNIQSNWFGFEGIGGS